MFITSQWDELGRQMEHYFYSEEEETLGFYSIPSGKETWTGFQRFQDQDQDKDKIG